MPLKCGTSTQSISFTSKSMKTWQTKMRQCHWDVSVARGQLGLVTRKHVFGVSDQVRLKPDCSATGTSWSLEIPAIASGCILLSKQRTTKALIRLRGCAGCSAPLLFAYGINRFSHDVAQLHLTFVLK